jgi:hypothetical protein
MTYIPFMIAMLKPEFIQHSCYKIMFLIAVIDLFVLPCNAIIAGIQCMFGLHFCANPTLFFWSGAIATGKKNLILTEENRSLKGSNTRLQCHSFGPNWG